MSAAAGDLVLERFRLERPLASGAMGEVWAARASGSKDRFAVKLSAASGRERAEREAAALARLDHRGVVRHVAHGDGPDGGFVLVMELVDGVPLSKLLKVQPPDVAAALLLIADVADALHHAHGRGVVHRDVKASNLLVVREGRATRPVLIDFGIGLVHGSSRLSSGDVVLGSAHTMPPEQMLGLPVGPAADIYSLACLLFRMIAGRYPYHASSQVQVLAMHAHGRIPSLGDRAERDLRAPPGVDALLQQCLSKRPDERVADAATLAERLRALAATPGSQWVDIAAASPDDESSGTFTRPPVVPLPPPPRRWPWVVAAIALAAAAAYALS